MPGKSDQSPEGADEASELQRVLGGYAELLECLPVVVYVADLDDHSRLRYVSPHIESLLGYPPAEWLGDSTLFRDRIHPGDRDRVLAALRDRGAGEEVSAGEFRIVARDGRTVWLADRRVVAEAAGGRVTVGMVTDITERKEAELALMRGKQLNDVVMESLGEGLVVLDRDGQVVTANTNAAEIMGVSLDELCSSGVARPVVEAFLEDGSQLDGAHSLTRRVLDDGEAVRDVPIRIVRRDRSERWVSANYLPLRGGAGKEIQGVIWSLGDVTETRRVAHELAETERRFQDIVENVEAVFWVRRIDSDEVVYVGPAYEEIWGRSVAQLYHTPHAWLDAIHADDRERVMRAALDAPAPDEYDAEYRIIRPDGEIRWIHDRAFTLRGSVEHAELVSGIAEDVTERHATEEALVDARERVRAAFLNAPIGSAIFSLRDGGFGQLVEINPAFCAMLGYPEAEMLGRSPEDFVGADADRRRRWQRLVTGETESYDVEGTLVRSDGREIWARLRMSIIRDADGEPAYGVAQAEDITISRRAEAQAAAVAKLGQQALVASGLEELMDDALAAVQGTLGTTIVGVLEYVPEYEAFVPRVSAGVSGDVHIPERDPIAGADHLRFAQETGQPAVVQDWAREERFELSEFTRALGAVSTLSVPIQGPDGTWGVLSTHACEPRGFAPDEVSFAQSVANVLGAAIQRRLAEQETQHRALHDPLTELPNRTLFLDRLGHALERAGRSGTPVAVLFMDLDHFKVINDSLGHDIGDRLLNAFAPRLTDTLRPSDTVARFGGDEFVVLCEDLRSEDDAVILAERILDSLRDPFTIGTHELFTSATIGLALAREGDSPEGLIRDADAAMYRAKARGRGRYEVFDQAMRERVSERLRTENALRRALADGALSVAFQPIVSLHDRSIVGAEALLRWHDAQRGWIPPDHFIPIAEESGLIVPIGEWVLEQAVRVALDWPSVHDGAGMPQLAVNLSARQVAHPIFREQLAEVLARTGLAPERLSLEITESVLMEEAEGPMEAVRELKRLGVGLVLDDFGTGYSSLSYLNRLPIDVLKLDRSFIAPLRGPGDTTAAIVSGVVTMAEALGMTVVAEGIEHESQVETLRSLGCALAQGFLFARPMPAADLADLLRAGTPATAS